MSQMNEALADQNDSSMFVTFFAGTFDLKTSRLTYCNGGHDAPLLLNAREKRVEPLPCSSNLPLGAMPGWEFEVQETMIAPGTLIFLYTDGLTEAEERDHQLFGSRIFKVAEQMLDEQDISPTRLIEQMTHAVHQFVGDAEQSDDLTMLAIKWNNQ
jgi:sigma-B regulation protein RsbU (phosphoserine phosphatase)